MGQISVLGVKDCASRENCTILEKQEKENKQNWEIRKA